jgi:thioredoxin 1
MDALKEEAMSDLIIHGTDDGFDQEVMKSELPVLVDFWAPWCGPCLMIAPVLEEFAQTYQGKLKIVKINVDENGKTPMTYGVMAIPTLILFKGGELKEKSVGVLPKAKLTELVSRYL